MFKLRKFLLPTLVLSSLLIGYQQEVNGVDLKHQQEAKRNDTEDKKEVKKTEEVVFNIKKIEDNGLEVKYPVFKGEAFKDVNDFINKEVKKFVNDYKGTVKDSGGEYPVDFYLDIKPHIIDKEVINLKESIYVNAGGAHGDSAESWIVFVKDENQKKYVQVKLSDIMNLDKKCEKDLRQTIYKKLKKQGSYYPDLKLLENFYLDKKGIVFVFNPESVGLSRYEGISLVKIPYSFPCIKKDGITKKFLD